MILGKVIIGAAVSSLMLSEASFANKRDYISIVGSSTVYPFATVVAEKFGRSTQFKTPKIESTGSGGGFKLFCAGIGVNHPDITNASRRVKQSELDLCRKNGVTDIVEVKVGYDGIALANSKKAAPLNITRKQLYLALAKKIPGKKAGEWIDNPYQKWSDIDKSLPNKKIEVLGPPPTSGTRDAFVELAMEGGCKKFGWVKALKKQDKKLYKKNCHSIREDGKYVEAGENDNLIVQKLDVNKNAYGIFGYSFLDQNGDRVQGAKIDGVLPEFEEISSGNYPVSRSLYYYIKKAHVGVIPGLKEYAQEFAGKKASGNDGYLADRGLIPMPAKEQAAFRTAIDNLKVLPASI